MTQYLRCTDCPVDWVVSEEDPDSTLSDVMEHVQRRHAVRIEQAHHHFEEGVNRCRDDVHSMPHKGCILR